MAVAVSQALRALPWAAALGVAVVASGAEGAVVATLAAGEGGRWGCATLANTLLAGAAILYGAFAWLRQEAVGCAATALAGAGALGVFLALGLHAPEIRASGAGLFEAMAALSAGAVLAYLAMERIYGNRSAGFAVMAAVMLAVLCEMWLIAGGAASGAAPDGGLGPYWMTAHQFALAIAYGPIAAAALLAALSRARPASRIATSWATHALLSVGAPLLVLAGGMGAAWLALERPAPQAAAGAAFAALCAALVMGSWARTRGPHDPRLGRRACGAFLVASAAMVAVAPWAAIG